MHLTAESKVYVGYHSLKCMWNITDANVYVNSIESKAVCRIL